MKSCDLRLVDFATPILRASSKHRSQRDSSTASEGRMDTDLFLELDVSATLDLALLKWIHSVSPTGLAKIALPDPLAAIGHTRLDERFLCFTERTKFLSHIQIVYTIVVALSIPPQRPFEQDRIIFRKNRLGTFFQSNKLWCFRRKRITLSSVNIIGF